MPLALNVIQKKGLCSAEKSSIILAEPHSKSLAEPNFWSVTISHNVPGILSRFKIMKVKPRTFTTYNNMPNRSSTLIEPIVGEQSKPVEFGAIG